MPAPVTLDPSRGHNRTKLICEKTVNYGMRISPGVGQGVIAAAWREYIPTRFPLPGYEILA